MKTPSRSYHPEHVADLLPGFVNQTLSRPERDTVLVHIQGCVACATELRAWESIREGTRLAIAQAPVAPVSVLDSVLARIDTQSLNPSATQRLPASTSRSFPETPLPVRTSSPPEEPMTSLAISPLPVYTAPSAARPRTVVAPQPFITRWLSLLAAAVLLLATLVGFGLLDPPTQSRLGSVLPWQPTSSANVPMFRGDPHRTGVMPGPGPTSKPDVLWRAKTGGPMATSPVIDDGTIYTPSLDGAVYAFDLATGEERWHTEIGGGPQANMTVADGVVLAGDNNPYEGDGTLFALDAADGHERWSLADVQTNSPLVVDGIAYVGTTDGHLLALDPRDGSERWRTDAAPISRSPALADGVLYYGGRDGTVYALDAATGQERWRYETAGGQPGTLALGNGLVYQATLDGPDDQLYALDAATGEERWRFNVGTRLQGPTIGDGVVYIAGGDGSIYALDAMKGTVRWRFAANDSNVYSPVMVGDTLYVTSGGPTVYALDVANGKERWHVDVDNPIGTSPVVSGGVIYVVTEGGDLIALGEQAADAPVVLPAPSVEATSNGPIEFLWQATNGSAPIDAVGGLALAPDGSIWVPETTTNRILIFSPDGVFEGAWGTAGPSEGEFDFNLEEGGGGYGDLAFDQDGNVYVLDSGNYRVQKFDRTRRFVTTIGEHGSRDGQFLGPVTIAMDAQGNLYVADDLRGDIQKFASDGTYLATISSRGEGEGQTECIPDFAVAADGTLYVPDCWRHQVQLFAPDGNYLATWGSEGKGKGQFQFPSTVAIDPAGRVYIADSGNNRVQVFTPDGDFVTAWGQFGSGEGDFNGSGSVLLDGLGNIYVGDGNGRIQKFQLKPPLGPAGAATPEA